jgi:hypothetical protein
MRALLIRSMTGAPMSPRRLLPLAMLPLVACGGGAPYSLDLAVKRTTSGTSTTTAYQINDGGDPVERAGTIGAGENCVVAGQSSGTRTGTRIYEIQEQFNVVGETEAELPLVPGEEDASKVWASILRESVRAAASIETTETVVDVTADPAQWETRTYTDEAHSTTAGYHAVAADEFVVRMDMVDLWDDLEEMDHTEVELMTMNAPGKGDVWPSQNGNSLYVWEASEKLTIGGVTMKTDRIAVYATGTVSPEGEDTAVYDQCFNFGLAQVDDSRPDVEAVDSDAMLLDPGCVGSFEHVKQGTQWWYGNVLVKETSTVTFVAIHEFGYEWTEEDEATGTCARIVSPTRDEPTGLPFVQYDVTVTAVETIVKSYAD